MIHVDFTDAPETLEIEMIPKGAARRTTPGSRWRCRRTASTRSRRSSSIACSTPAARPARRRSSASALAARRTCASRLAKGADDPSAREARCDDADGAKLEDRAYARGEPTRCRPAGAGWGLDVVRGPRGNGGDPHHDEPGGSQHAVSTRRGAHGRPSHPPALEYGFEGRRAGLRARRFKGHPSGNGAHPDGLLSPASMVIVGDDMFVTGPRAARVTGAAGRRARRKTSKRWNDLAHQAAGAVADEARAGGAVASCTGAGSRARSHCAPTPPQCPGILTLTTFRTHTRRRLGNWLGGAKVMVSRRGGSVGPTTIVRRAQVRPRALGRRRRLTALGAPRAPEPPHPGGLRGSAATVTGARRPRLTRPAGDLAADLPARVLRGVNVDLRGAFFARLEQHGDVPAVPAVADSALKGAAPPREGRRCRPLDREGRLSFLSAAATGP